MKSNELVKMINKRKKYLKIKLSKNCKNFFFTKSAFEFSKLSQTFQPSFFLNIFSNEY